MRTCEHVGESLQLFLLRNELLRRCSNINEYDALSAEFLAWDNSTLKQLTVTLARILPSI